MSERFVGAIEAIQITIGQLEKSLSEKKMAVNELCRMAERPPIYHEIANGRSMSIRPDEFYGKPLASVLRSVLEKRGRDVLGAATVEEIYEAMAEGGYQFKSKNIDNAKRGLNLALSKNSASFHRLPNGRYGLREWYPAMTGPQDKE